MHGLCEKFGEVVGVGPGLFNPPPPSTRELLHTTHEMVLLLIHEIFSWQLHIKNTPENKLTQYDTHNPTFTVQKVPLEKTNEKKPEASGPLCPLVKVSDLVNEQFHLFQKERVMWWTVEKLT